MGHEARAREGGRGHTINGKNRQLSLGRAIGNGGRNSQCCNLKKKRRIWGEIQVKAKGGGEVRNDHVQEGRHERGGVAARSIDRKNVNEREQDK